MKRVTAWVVAGCLVVLTIAPVTVAQTSPGQRALRYLDRKYGITQLGQQAAFDLLWARARQQYGAQDREPYGPLFRAAYAEKEQLLAQRERSLAAVREASSDGVVDRFVMDLALSLGQDEARTLVRAVLRSERCGWGTPGFSDALAAAFSAAERKQMLMELPAPCDQIAFTGTPLSPEEMQALILHRGYVPAYLLFEPTGTEAALKVYDRLDRTAKLDVIRAVQEDEQLRMLLTKEKDPAVAQSLLQRLRLEDELLASIERDGFFPGVSLPWQRERELAGQFPDSFLARGIRAYEAVRGQAYFAWDRQEPWQHGNRYYDPNREIPGWEAYLKEFSRHEGADDAAYRLGRSYEIKGEYAKALTALLTATELPDGEMAYHARNRIVWILDALLDEAALRSLKGLDPRLQTAVDYSIALRELRTGRYAEAAEHIGRLAGADPLPTGFRQFYGHLDFGRGLAKQREIARALDELARTGTDQARYDLAATIYHDELIFYNYLWEGGRQEYLLYGGYALSALQGDMDPAYSLWVAQSNNYIQAAAAFAAITGAPEELQARADYSRAMALLKVSQGYGRDVELWRPTWKIAEEAAELLKRFVAAHPRSDVAPDALLSLGYVTGDQAHFDRILKEYPRSSAAVTARSPEPSKSYGGGHVPFRYVTLEQLPYQVEKWANGLIRVGESGSMTDEDYTYVLAVAPEPGLTGHMVIIHPWDGGPVTASVRWSDEQGPGYVLARLDRTEERIEVR